MHDNRWEGEKEEEAKEKEDKTKREEKTSKEEEKEKKKEEKSKPPTAQKVNRSFILIYVALSAELYSRW